MLKSMVAAAAVALSASASAATLTQTVHFNGASAEQMFRLYASSEGHQSITGLSANYLDGAGATVPDAVVGGQLMAFCFEPEKCALNAQILDIQESPGVYTMVMSWWNFGWLMATDATDYTLEQRGAPDSSLIITFRDTLRGAQVELVQANVPDYPVVIPNPDGTEENGPLSTIINTHWNTLYWDKLRRLVSE